MKYAFVVRCLFAVALLIGTDRLLGAATDGTIQRRIDAEYTSLEKLYVHLHAHPELSYREAQTAAKLADELKRLGLEVATGIGGHGVVGLLRNGAGPTV